MRRNRDNSQLRGALLSTIFVILWSSRLLGAPVTQLEFSPATVDCPSPQSIASELTQIAPQLRVLLGPPGAAPTNERALLDVADLGDHYRVSVAGAIRTFGNAARNCEERARTVAVFVVATLYPPFIALDEPPPAVSPRVASPPIASPPIAPPPIAEVTIARPARPLRIDLDVAGIFALATESLPPVVGGATLRLFAAWKNIGGTIGVSALSPFRLQLEGATLNVTRIPIDFSLQIAIPKNRFEVKAMLGFVLGIAHADGATGINLKGTTFADPGIGGGAQFAYWVHPRIAPFVAINAIISVAPRDFAFGLSGNIGSMPLAWLSLAAGVTFKLY